jgi:hypothetical protein
VFAPSLVDILSSWDDGRTADRTRHLVSPSDLASGCDRRTMYRVRGTEPDTDTDNRKAIAGTLIHGGLKHAIEAAGGVVEAVCHFPHPGIGDGHADIVWTHDGTVDDVKTKSDRAYQRWMNHGPDEGELEQARAYAWAVHHGLADPGEDATDPARDADLLAAATSHVDTVRIVAYNRDTGESHEWVEAYDDDTAWAAVIRMGRLSTDIDNGVDIPRQGNGPGTGFPCDWCEFAATCWDLTDVPEGRTPQSRDVDVADATWVAAAADYLAAQQDESKAKKRKADARVWLAGVPGEGGGYKVAFQGGRTIPAHTEPDPDAMEVLIEEAGMEVPLREVPESTTTRSIRVTRTRAQ